MGAFINFNGRIPNCTDWDIFGTGELPANVRGSGGKDQLLVWQLKYEPSYRHQIPGFYFLPILGEEKHKPWILLLIDNICPNVLSLRRDCCYNDWRLLNFFTSLLNCGTCHITEMLKVMSDSKFKLVPCYTCSDVYINCYNIFLQHWLLVFSLPYIIFKIWYMLN